MRLWFRGTVGRRGWLLFAAMCVLWGLPYAMIKLATDEVSPAVLVFARTSAGAVVLLPLAIRSGSLAMLRRSWPWMVVFAAVEIIGPWWLTSDAEVRLSSSMTGLLIASAPIIAVLVARFFREPERLTTIRCTGLLAGLAGVVLIAIPNLGGYTTVSIVEVLIAAIGYATAPLIAEHRLGTVPGVVLMAGCLTFAALFYIGPAAATWPATMPSVKVLLALAGLAVLCTAVGFVAFFALIREVGATRATVVTYVNPAVAVVAGVVLLDEAFTPAMVSAFAMILFGSVLATRRGSAPADDNVDSPAAGEQELLEPELAHGRAG